jgi:hypothetical protein
MLLALGNSAEKDQETVQDQGVNVKMDEQVETGTGTCLPSNDSGTVTTMQSNSTSKRTQKFSGDLKSLAGDDEFLNETRKSERERKNLVYAGEIVVEENRWKILLETKKFKTHSFKKMQGSQVTLDYLSENGFTEPIIIEDPAGLHMKMPPADMPVWFVDFRLKKLQKWLVWSVKLMFWRYLLKQTRK